MSRPALTFAAIEVLRFPGFPRGGPVLEELSPGLNLVYGPNASGKSTTVRAAKALLWPERLRGEPGAALAARFELDGTAYALEVEGGRGRYQRDGSPAPAPLLPPASFHDRYDLALETLLAAEGEPLAREIQREVAGGYDLDAAVEKAGFRDKASQPRKLAEQLAQTERQVSELTRGQQDLLRQEETLRDLQARLDEAREARRQTEALGRALALAQAERRRREGTARLASYPAVLARLRGNEAEQHAELRSRRAEAELQAEEAEVVIRRLSDELAGLGLGLETLAREDVAALATRLERLREVERERLQAEREEAESEALTRQALAAFAASETPDLERFHAAPAETLPRLGALLREAEDLRAAETLAMRAREALGEPQAGEDPAALARLGALLQRWQAGAGSLLVAAAGLGLALVLGWTALRLQPAGDALWLPPVAAAALALALAGWQALLVRDRAHLHREIERTGLRRSAAAGGAAAEGELDALAERLRVALDRQARNEVSNRLGLDAPRLDAARQALARRSAEVAGRLGVQPDLDVLHLAFLVDRLRDAAVAHDRLLAARASLGPLRREHQELHSRLAAGVAACGLAVPEAPDVPAMAAQIAELDRRQRSQAQLAEQLAAQSRAREAARAQLADNEARLAALWLGLDLPAGDPASDTEHLAAWQAELPDYQKAQKELDFTEREIASLRAGLASEAALLDLDEPELERRRARAQELAQQEEGLAAGIVTIETRVADARRKHDLEAALAARDTAREALRDEREQDLVRVAGWLLAERLREEVSERSQPAVLRRAEELFAAITRDRYQLRTLAGHPPALRAIERATHQGLDLDQLSAGTRVQLLLCVRLAFVELHEPGVALPLFLDELLATSDGERATAVIEAVAAFARAGRQVFVFTAQESEIVLWLTVLEELERQGLGVPHRELDLGELRAAAERERRRGLPAPSPRAAVPAPAGLDHATYGERLGVPGFEPLSEEVSALHLWYLIEDLPLLHRLLSAGYERWGQAVGLLARDLAEIAAPGSGPALARATALARALAAALAAWRIGRGRPVDRAALAASGAVSERYLDEVAALAAAVQGDAAALRERLEAGEVKGFRGGKLQELEAFLDAERYLDRRPRRPSEDIRLEALAAVREELARGEPSLGEVERALGRLALSA